MNVKFINKWCHWNGREQPLTMLHASNKFTNVKLSLSYFYDICVQEWSSPPQTISDDNLAWKNSTMEKYKLEIYTLNEKIITRNFWLVPRIHSDVTLKSSEFTAFISYFRQPSSVLIIQAKDNSPFSFFQIHWNFFLSSCPVSLNTLCLE